MRRMQKDFFCFVSRPAPLARMFCFSLSLSFLFFAYLCASVPACLRACLRACRCYMPKQLRLAGVPLLSATREVFQFACQICWFEIFRFFCVAASRLSA